jgi:hypothetical protein
MANLHRDLHLLPPRGAHSRHVVKPANAIAVYTRMARDSARGLNLLAHTRRHRQRLLSAVRLSIKAQRPVEIWTALLSSGSELEVPEFHSASGYARLMRAALRGRNRCRDRHRQVLANGWRCWKSSQTRSGFEQTHLQQQRSSRSRRGRDKRLKRQQLHQMESFHDMKAIPGRM